MKNTVMKLAILTMLMASCSLGQAQNQLKETAEGNSKAIREALVHMSEQDLKGLYLSCSNASSKRLLDMGEAIVCSTGAEELKNRIFLGNFEETLAWWRSHKHEETKDLSEYFNK